MGKVIGIHNQKGGVAKSTLSCVLATEIFASGKSVVLFDLDSQRSITKARKIELSYTEVSDDDIFDIIELPGNYQKVINSIKDSYDYVILDMPGHVSDRVILDAYEVLDHLFIPTSLSNQDINVTYDFIETVMEKLFPNVQQDLKISGVIVREKRGNNRRIRDFANFMRDGMNGVKFIEGAVLYDLGMFKSLETINRYVDKANPVYVTNFANKLLNAV